MGGGGGGGERKSEIALHKRTQDKYYHSGSLRGSLDGGTGG